MRKLEADGRGISGNFRIARALRIPHAYVHAEADSQTKGLVALPTAEGVWDKLPDATDDVSREEQRLQR